MEFISCRVLQENIPYKPSPWWVGEGKGRFQTSWKTDDKMGTKRAPGLSPPLRPHPLPSFSTPGGTILLSL